MELPKSPMTPIYSDELPEGPGWGFQLKWDGVRLLAEIDQGDIRLYSRSMLPKNNVYPEITDTLRQQSLKGSYVLDGEAVAFNLLTQKPDFPKILQRERSAPGSGVRSKSGIMIIYVLFDLLYDRGEDIRELPYQERHSRLARLFPDKQAQLFVSDLFDDGAALWDWVEQRSWEGVVSKRLSSTYREGKQHKDWFKKKTAVILQVQIVGLTIRGGQVASLVMLQGGAFFGKVSLGLNVKLKRQLLEWGTQHGGGEPLFAPLPPELKGEQVLWLTTWFPCTVTGLEVTAGGLLRHPKLVSFELVPGQPIVI
ncbi:DNA ligase [Paenibacillus thalictri]|uniref:DNA ligase n=1 Tax=Paenibacillus thalictri TaxID=2527873 RepID=A0A4Q9DQK7_9BACL|nr:DNA ligase [Paenibacillus thalictri]TBL78693.1 DNA ligase [Paenibacillus thalictri]